MSMKKAAQFWGIIALAAVIGFSMTGCEDPTSLLSGKTLSSITLNTDSVKKAYVQNQALSLAGLVVTANYSDGSSAAVANYTASPANGAKLSETGSTTVTVSYTEGAFTKTADFSVTVAAKTVASITANYTGTGNIYTFDQIDSLKGGLTVTPKYNDDSVGEPLAPEDYELDGELTAGTSTITVKYEGKETTFTVTVTAATLDSINVVFDQDDETIYTSTPLESLRKYLTVTATFSFADGQETRTETLTSQYALSGELKANPPTITVSYGDKTETFTPTVTAVVLESITAQFTATVTIYTSTQLDSLKQYLTVKAAYNDGNQETLEASEYTLTGALTAGTPEITVSYTKDSVTKTDTFKPTVTAVALDRITASYTGSQVLFNSDVDDLKTALTVTAYYNDGSNQTVTTYTLPGTFTAIGAQTITVSYTDGGVTKTTTFTVTVTCNHAWETATVQATETTDGVEGKVCTICSSKEGTILYATGSAGLDFTLIASGTNANTYRVHNTDTGNGTAAGAIFIPAYHRPNATSPYLPVTEIGNGTNEWENNAFGGTNSNPNTTITSVTFADNSQLKTINYYAFYYCTGLTSITIPASVTSISGAAFSNCTSLTSITIPASVTYTERSSFSSCTSLTAIMVADNNPNYASEGGILYNKAKTTIIIAPGGISGAIMLPASVTRIEYNAFASCGNLTSVTFAAGSQLKTIGEYAFLYCSSLTSITIPEGVTDIFGGAFYYTKLTSVMLPASVTNISSSAFDGCSSLATITVAANNPNYASQDGILYNKAKTEFVHIPAKLAGSVTIPNGITSIGGSAFYGCTGLTSVTIGNSVTTIGDYAFSGCTGITGVTIPNSVTTIGSGAFYGCTGLTGITFAGNSQLKTIGGEAFRSCTGITEITIPASVTAVGYKAFGSWTASQTIFVHGYTSQTAADNAWSPGEYDAWRYECNALIIYGVVLPPPPNAIMVKNLTEWNAALTTIRNGGNDKSYSIYITAAIGVAGSTASTFGSVTGVSVTLQGYGYLDLTSNGNMFSIGANQTLIIDSETLTFWAYRKNNPLVYVGSNAQLEWKNGTISGNENYLESSSRDIERKGGGVFVASGGSFTMSGGSIYGTAYAYSRYPSSTGSPPYGTSSAYGGGVYNEGTFTMLGGTVSGSAKAASQYNATVLSPYGGGIYNAGTFRIAAGTVSGTKSDGGPETNAAFATASAATAQRGTFTGSTWNSLGTLSTTDNTIRVVNGALQ